MVASLRYSFSILSRHAWQEDLPLFAYSARYGKSVSAMIDRWNASLEGNDHNDCRYELHALLEIRSDSEQSQKNVVAYLSYEMSEFDFWKSNYKRNAESTVSTREMQWNRVTKVYLVDAAKVRPDFDWIELCER